MVQHKVQQHPERSSVDPQAMHWVVVKVIRYLLWVVDRILRRSLDYPGRADDCAIVTIRRAIERRSAAAFV